MNEHIKYIKGGKIILEDQILENKVIVFDDKILDILDEKDLEVFDPLNRMVMIETHDCYVSPGLIDIHIHGSNGKDTMDGSLESLETMAASVIRSGVTAFLPTTMTMEWNKIYQALDIIRLARDTKINGARILGAYLEGPFINRVMKGAQDAKYIKEPNYNSIKAYEDIIKIITIAPEEDYQFQFIKKIKESTNIILSIGHTNADFETSYDSIHAGISNVTHIFNAMTPFHHRYPGPLGAIFQSEITCELIADNYHVHPAVYQILINIKGKDKVILITDSMKATFMQGNIWDFGGQKVFLKNNSVRLSDGTLAGSVLKLNEAVLNILRNTDLKIYEAISLASLNAAKLLHLDKKKGSIQKGKDADLTIFNQNFEVEMTIVEGKTVYQHKQM